MNKVLEKRNNTISKFQLQVYFFCSQIPKGYFTTYKYLAKVLKTSPRAIGKVLKNNPFCPEPVPCHRIIANNFYLGGYKGEWGQGENLIIKRKILKKEGLMFNKSNYLLKELRNKIIKEFNFTI